MLDPRRSELAEFLRHHRARLSPAELGLPGGVRRRTRGLRREEVAATAAVSTAWYTWLEQGRAVRPSIDALRRIARTLRLSAEELGYMALLIGLPAEPSAAAVLASGPSSLESSQRILDSFTHPACLYNARFDVLAANAAARAVYGADMASGSEWSRNMLWRTFLDADRRRMYPNVAKDRGIRNLIEVLRMSCARQGSSEDAAALVEELRHASQQFNELWLERRVAQLISVPGVVIPGGRGQAVNVQYSRMHIFDVPGQVIAAIIPTDAGSADALDRYLNRTL